MITGRPTVNEKDKKQSYTVSLSSTENNLLVDRFGSLTKALQSLCLPLQVKYGEQLESNNQLSKQLKNLSK